MSRSGRGGRRLTGEDRVLWEHLTRGLEPLARGKARVLGVELPEDDGAVPRDRQGRAELRHEPPAALRPRREEPPATRGGPSTAAAPPPIAPFDRKTARRLRTGRTEVEARLDLHGLRQADAHEALRRFIQRCQGRDLRTVLVITGKGGPAAGGGSRDDFGYGSEIRGVLKRNVPRWLDEADLRPMIVSYTTAAARHGGEGALYVHLRKRSR